MAESRASVGGSRATTHAQRLRSRDGYFAPESVIRRLGNTPLVPFLGGGPAVLLQVAHPLVAAGVFDHSDVRRDLWRRLVHTLRALYLIAFGTKEEAERVAEVVQTVHTRVHGATRTQLGRFPPGTPYSASDPELMLWVHATLVQRRWRPTSGSSIRCRAKIGSATTKKWRWSPVCSGRPPA